MTDSYKEWKASELTHTRPIDFFLLTVTLAVAHVETLTSRVVRVTDGDTLMVLDADNVQHKIR